MPIILVMICPCLLYTSTNTAIVLLGREESEHLISPAVAKIKWILRGPDKDVYKRQADNDIECRIISTPEKVDSDSIILISTSSSETEVLASELLPCLLYTSRMSRIVSLRQLRSIADISIGDRSYRYFYS